MKRRWVIPLALAILGIAGWAYNMNYKTMTALDRVSALRGQIAKEREAMQVLRVEWAYLNAPDRLARLVAAHNDQLRLGPLVPEHLGHVAAVPFPKGHEPEADPEAPSETIPIPAARPADWRPE